MLARTARLQVCQRIAHTSPGSSGTLHGWHLQRLALGYSGDGAGHFTRTDRRTRRLIFRCNIELTSFRWNVCASSGRTKLVDPDVTSGSELCFGNRFTSQQCIPNQLGIANGKTVVDTPESRAKMVFVALAIRAPASAETRRTLAGVGEAESMDFHGS